MRVLRFWVAALLCLVFVACGGGGGPPPFVVSLNQSSLTFDYRQGDTPPPQTLIATWTGDPPETVYVGAIVEGQAIDPVIPITISNTQATAVVKARMDLQPGEYAGRILFLVCSDSACNNRIGGSPLTVNYIVRVRATPLVSTAPLAFRYVWGAAASTIASQALTTTSASGSWTATANSSWIHLSAASGTGANSIGVQVDPTGLAEATHTGQITVTGGDGYSQTVSVSLAIEPLAIVMNSVSATYFGSLGAPPTAAQTFIIAFNNGVAGDWIAATSQPWISLSNASGATSSSLQVGVDTSFAMASGTYVGQVTIDASQNGRTLRQTVNIVFEQTRPTLLAIGSTDFTGMNGSPIPDHVISISLSNGVIAPVTLSSNQAWLIPRTAFGSTGGSFTIGIDQQAGNIGAGSFSGLITASATINGETISLLIPASILLSNPALILQSSFLHFGGVNGSDIAAQSQTVRVENNAPITLELQSDQSWLRVTDTSTSSGSSYSVTVDPSIGKLPSGSYSGKLTIGARLNGSLISRTVDVSLFLMKPTLSFSQSPVVLGGASGRDPSAVGLDVSLNTGANSFTWTTSGAPAWLTLSSTTGSASATPASLTVSPVRSEASPGTSQGTIVFAAVVNGDTVTANLPVSFNLDAHRLVASEVGVALASAGSWSKLTRTIHIRDNFGLAGVWNAVSDQPWLTVTPSGQHGGDLQLSADPSALSPGQWYDATVTITSSDASVAAPERVRVGFWVDLANLSTPVTLNGDHKFVAADPIRPYLYTHGDAGGDIRIIHFYTGAQIGSISTSATDLGPMTVSADGAYLYVMDKNAPTLLIIDLSTRANIGDYVTQNPGRSYLAIKYFRTNGVGFISVGQILRTQSGTVVTGLDLIGTTVGQFTAARGATADGRYFFDGAARYTLDYTAASGGVFLSKPDGVLAENAPQFGAAANADGSRVIYDSSFSAAPCGVMNGLSLVDLGVVGSGAGNANNYVVSANDAVLCTLVHQIQPSAADNFWVMDASGTLRASARLSADTSSSIVNFGAVFSGDGLISAVATESIYFDGVTHPGVTLHLIPIGP